MLQAGFIYFATVIVVCALLVVTRKNAVHSVLLMLPLFFHVAGIFIMLNAEFVAAIQLLVYAGAIMVLFLFVVMLLRVGREKHAKFRPGWPMPAALGLTIAGLFMAILVGSDMNGTQGVFTVETVQRIGNSESIGRVLYTDFLFPFEVASLILLVAMIGAIVLAKKKLD